MANEAYFAQLNPPPLTPEERWRATEAFFRWIGGEPLDYEEYSLLRHIKDYGMSLGSMYVCQPGHSESIAEYRQQNEWRRAMRGGSGR